MRLHVMTTRVPAAHVKKIVFACEAGMGSSRLGATQLEKRLKASGLSVRVENHAVHQIPTDTQVVLCHQGLLELARQRAPWAVVLAFEVFLNDPAYERLAQALAHGSDIEASP